MRTLIIYFSQTGKTKAVAKKVSELIKADLFEIKTVKSYEMSYKKTVLLSIKEILTKERPELAVEIPNCQDYDRILIGCPIWCGGVPNAVLTFMDKAELTGKQVALFTTSGSTKPMKLASKLKKSYSDCRWHKPLNGNDASEEEIKKWLSK